MAPAWRVTAGTEAVAVAALAVAVVVAAAAALVEVDVAAPVDEARAVVATVAELVVFVGAAEDAAADDVAACVVTSASEAVVEAAAGAAAEPPQAASATLPRAARPKVRKASRREKAGLVEGLGMALLIFFVAFQTAGVLVHEFIRWALLHFRPIRYRH